MGRRKTETEQVNVRLPTEIVERIDAVIATYGRRSRNQVCAEVIETYLPFWEEMERERESLLGRQQAALAQVRAGANGNAEPIDMFVPEPMRVPVIGGKRAPDRIKATGELVHPQTKHPQTTRKGVKKQ